MPELSYLHISDAHFPDSAGDAYELDKVTKSLLNTLEHFYKKGMIIDLIFFTGDLAYSGKDYKKASLFFEELLRATGLDERLNKGAKERLFIVPGNHDVYRKETGYVQRTLNSIKEANDFFQSSKADNRKAHFKRFRYFSRFYNNFFASLRSYTAAKHWFAEKITLAIDDKELIVGVVGLNTAWFSKDEQDQNKLWVGERTCRIAYDHLYKDERPDIIFTLHHHPYEWLHPLDRKEVQGLINHHTDFDLFGHLHEAYTEQVNSSYGPVLRFQAGALFDTDQRVKRAFIGRMNLDNGAVYITPISYESNPHDLWTIDPTLYPDRPDYVGEFRLNKYINLHKRSSLLSKSNSIPTEEKLAPYYERLSVRIESVKIDRFIDLGLAIAKSHRAKWSNLRHRGEPLRTFDIFELADTFPTQRIALVGDPGAGKTTLLTELVKRYIKSDQLIPIFIPMGLYYIEKNLIDFFDLKELDTPIIEDLLEMGRFLVVFDGVNESPVDNLDDVFHSIIKFIKKYPSNKYFLSCRTSEFPDWVHEDLTEVTILPVSMDEIEHQFRAVLGDYKGREIMDRISLEQGYTRLKELCQNPLLLAMLLTIYKDTIEDDPGRITSRARLYEKFLQRMEHRERKKRKPREEERILPSGLREEILSLIGFKMQEKELVYVVEETLQRWLVEAIDSGHWDTWWRPGERPTLQTLFRNAVGKPPVKAIEDEEDPKYFAFLHQSFGEYYSALYLKNNLDSDKLELGDLDLFILDATRRQWEVITLLCGLLDNAERITSYIKHKAEELRNQSLLVLAGYCVRDAGHIPSQEADDVRIRLIDAFKYWENPFDYELIHAIKETMGRQGPLFPQRLAEDALRFTEKYAQVIPIELRETSIETLKLYLFSGDSALIIDAAYTLGNRKYRSELEKREVTDFILTRLESTTGIVREQIIMALKMLADPVSLPTLLKIIANTDESPRARAFALNGLGQIGDLSATQPIIDYLLNHQNPYRDSASWSLQMLGKIAVLKEPKLAVYIKDIYMQALLDETDDIEGRYAKGNIIYSLGILRATEFTDQILEWIMTQRDDYVLEDAVNAIGNLGEHRASGILIAFINWDDPVVRMKAANALGEIGYCEAIPNLESLKSDPFPIVRETAKQAIEKLRSLED